MKNKYLIAIRITCVLLCILLLGGVAAVLCAQKRHAEEETPKKYRDYALWLWADEDIALLQRAAQKNDLFFEITADYVRQIERLDYNLKTARSWIAYDLDRQDFLEDVEPLLDEVFVPSQGDAYSYSDLRIYRPLGESLSYYSTDEKISVQFRTGGCSATVSMLKYPELRLGRVVDGKTYDLYTTVTTADGYDISYYAQDFTGGIRSIWELVQQKGMDTVWGEFYVHEDQPLYMTVGYGEEFARRYDIPTQLQDSTLISYGEHLLSNETVREATEEAWRSISLTYYGIWGYAALVLVVIALLIVFHLQYRKGVKVTKSGRYATGIRVCCLLLSMLLLTGIMVYDAYAYRRAEREEYYATAQPELSVGFDSYEEDYYLWLWTDEEMALLQRAANKNALYYEIAADYVRHWRAGEVDGYVDWSWLPYDLDRKTYQREVGALLEQLYVPFLPDFHANEFDYGDIRVHRQYVSATDNGVSRISVSLEETEKATGEKICSSWTSIRFDPLRWQHMFEKLGSEYLLYETITTLDGHDITYYTSEHLEDSVEIGSSWGELVLEDDQRIEFGLGYYNNGPYGRDSLKSLSESKLISYAEHLETNPELEERVSTQWRTISLIYYGVILYGLLTVAAVGTIIACTMLYRKEKRAAHKE